MPARRPTAYDSTVVPTRANAITEPTQKTQRTQRTRRKPYPLRPPRPLRSLVALIRRRPLPEMLLVPGLELVDAVRVTQAAEVLERIGGRDAAHPRAQDVRQMQRQTLHQAAAIGVADACRIDDAVRRDRGDVSV